MNDPFFLTDHKKYEHNNRFMEYNRIGICSVSTEKSVVKVVLDENSMNLHGTAHGGLIYAMCDCAAGVTARADGSDYVTQNANIHFLRNVSSGTIYAAATEVKRGRRVLLMHIEVTAEDGKLLADGSVEMMRI